MGSLCEQASSFASKLPRLDLRFSDPNQEKGFLQVRTEKLLARTSFCASILVACNVVFLLWPLQELQAERSETAMQVAKVQAGSLIVTITVASLMVIGTKTSTFRKKISCTLREIAIMLVILFCMCLLISFCSSVFLITKILGKDPVEAWGQNHHFSDTFTLLAIDAFVSGSHLALPLRWQVLVWIEVIPLALFATFNVVYGNDSEFWVGHVVMLAGLMMISSTGKRAAEIHERNLFVALADERTLRCEAEFKLVQGIGSGSGGLTGMDNQDNDSDKQSSLPSSSRTGQVFDAFYQNEQSTRDSIFNAISMLGSKEHWLIRTDEVQLFPDKILGQGGFGVVLGGAFYGTPVAVKLSLSEFRSDNLRKVPELANELRILRQGRHPNLVQLLGAAVDVKQHRLALVLELIDGPDLDRFMRGQPPNIATQYALMLGVCRALWYLHSRQPSIVHGDLKSANVLVECTNNGVRPKLLDFGLSRLLTNRSRPLGGTIAWMAPEVFMHKGTSADTRPRASADVFSFGHLIFLICTGIAPFKEMDQWMIAQILKSAALPPQDWPGTSILESHCKSLVSACLQRAENLRPAIAQIHGTMIDWLGEPELAGDLQDVMNIAMPGGSRDWNGGLYELGNSMTAQRKMLRFPSLSRKRNRSAEVQAMGHLKARLPAVPEDKEAKDQKNGSSSNEGRVATGSGCGVSKLVVSSLKMPTASHSRRLTLVATIMQWNYELPPNVCCRFHAGVQAVQAVCSSFNEGRCIPDFHSVASEQCMSCGLLMTDDSNSPTVDENGQREIICEMCIQLKAEQEQESAESDAISVRSRSRSKSFSFKGSPRLAL